eukprot:scaffold18610_cov63-Phaeocystis_antarctica.AAC.6
MHERPSKRKVCSTSHTTGLAALNATSQIAALYCVLSRSRLARSRGSSASAAAVGSSGLSTPNALRRSGPRSACRVSGSGSEALGS